MEQVLTYVSELFLTNGIVIAVAAYVVGALIKGSLDFVPNKYIPLICGALGAVLGVTIPSAFPDAGVVIKAINGLALGWAATGGVETVKNLKSGG